jgi:hypothetical protein
MLLFRQSQQKIWNICSFQKKVIGDSAKYVFVYAYLFSNGFQNRIQKKVIPDDPIVFSRGLSASRRRALLVKIIVSNLGKHSLFFFFYTHLTALDLNDNF